MSCFVLDKKFMEYKFCNWHLTCTISKTWATNVALLYETRNFKIRGWGVSAPVFNSMEDFFVTIWTN